MRLSRRSLLTGFVAGAAGLLLPAAVAAEPARRIWALDQTMLRPPSGVIVLDGVRFPVAGFLETGRFDTAWVWETIRVHEDREDALRGVGSPSAWTAPSLPSGSLSG